MRQKPLLNSAAARCKGKQGGKAAAILHNAAGPLLRVIAAKPLRDAQENKAAKPLLNSLAYRRGIATATADRFPHKRFQLVRLTRPQRQVC
jgi:hypothetical protein